MRFREIFGSYVFPGNEKPNAVEMPSCALVINEALPRVPKDKLTWVHGDGQPPRVGVLDNQHKWLPWRKS